MILLICKDKSVSNKSAKPVVTYSKEKHGQILFRVTSVHKGEIDFAKTIEDLIVKKVLMHESTNLSMKD